jgi:hypothetical protein
MKDHVKDGPVLDHIHVWFPKSTGSMLKARLVMRVKNG